MNSKLRVGVVIKPHGIKGEIKVFPTTDDSERFFDLEKVLVRVHGHDKEESVSDVRLFKNIVIMKLSHVDSIEDAEKLRGAELYVRREDAVPLAEGEYYIADIIGMDVCTEEGERLGVIREVIDSAANDVYIVNRGEGRKELLIPAIKDCIKNVDLENNLMTVHLLEGLLDL